MEGPGYEAAPGKDEEGEEGEACADADEDGSFGEGRLLHVGCH